MITPDYYNKKYNGVKLDPYRIAEIYGITDHAIFHSIKKLLRAGQKPGNSAARDVQGAIAALERWVEIQEEDETAAAMDVYMKSDRCSRTKDAIDAAVFSYGYHNIDWAKVESDKTAKDKCGPQTEAYIAEQEPWQSRGTAGLYEKLDDERYRLTEDEPENAEALV